MKTRMYLFNPRLLLKLALFPRFLATVALAFTTKLAKELAIEYNVLIKCHSQKKTQFQK